MGSGRFNWLAALSLLLVFAPGRVFAQGGPVIVTPTSLPPAIVGTGFYSQTITATGGTAPYTFAFTGGTLPPGLSLSASGVLSGTATSAGTYNFLVTATDNLGAKGSWAYVFTVIGPPSVTTPTVNSVAATTATVGGTVASDGGVAVTSRGVVYALSSINSNPQIGGPGVVNVPTSTGSGVFTVNLTGLQQGTAYSFSAYAGNTTGIGYSPAGTFTTTTVTIAPLTLPGALAGVPYERNIRATGGTAPYTYTITSGALPTGLVLSTSGDITGTPTAGGFFAFTITATDATGATRAQSYTVEITPAVTITTTALPDYGLNLPGYSFTVEATGGFGDKTFSVIEGSFPPGLSLQPNGLIIGTPIIAGTYTFTIAATDTSGSSASRVFTIVIGGRVTITTATLLNASVGQTGYSQRIVATGGTGFKDFSLASGSLPAGMSLSSTGVLSGTPTVAGTYTFTVNATDALGEVNSRSFTIVINPALTFSTTTLPDSPVALTYIQTITTTGGTGAATFAVTSGALPTGLTLSSAGVISGTATTAGTYNFTITATDSTGATASQAYTVVVGGPVVVSPATLTAPLINVAATPVTLTASGGTGLKTFAVTSGSLPTGLTLSSAGVLSGTPTVAGTYNFTVTATDGVGGTGNRAYTVVIAPPVMVPQTIAFGALPNRLTSDGSFTLSAVATSGLPVSFLVSGPAVLNGSTLSLTGAPGVVTVTAVQAGNVNFAAAPNVVQTFTVTLADRLINLSSRVRIANNSTQQLIAGFVIGGTQPKRVLLRAIGPGLTAFGVTGAVTNPRLQLFDSANRPVLDNDDWSGAETLAAFAQVNAFGLAANSRDAAVVTTLAPGSYTMQVTAGTETGVALAEVYDASPNPAAETQRLVNISTRGNVEAGEGVLIGGFVVSGVTPKRVLIRGIGPGLTTFGVGGALADPRLSVFSGTTVIAQNDDWSVPTPITGQTAATAAELIAAAQSVGAFALGAGSRDAAVLVTLAPGAYTAQVAGPGTTSGVALVEVYEVP